MINSNIFSISNYKHSLFVYEWMQEKVNTYMFTYESCRYYSSLWLFLFFKFIILFRFLLLLFVKWWSTFGSCHLTASFCDPYSWICRQASPEQYYIVGRRAPWFRRRAIYQLLDTSSVSICRNFCLRRLRTNNSLTYYHSRVCWLYRRSCNRHRGFHNTPSGE